jgi:hypothetical protein
LHACGFEGREAGREAGWQVCRGQERGRAWMRAWRRDGEAGWGGRMGEAPHNTGEVRLAPMRPKESKYGSEEWGSCGGAEDTGSGEGG